MSIFSSWELLAFFRVVENVPMGNAERVAPIDYLPVYMVMFLDHDGLPPDLTFPKPSLDLPVSSHFKSRG